jgi:hypothetical protein
MLIYTKIKFVPLILSIHGGTLPDSTAGFALSGIDPVSTGVNSGVPLIRIINNNLYTYQSTINVRPAFISYIAKREFLPAYVKININNRF